ncbi:MAG TPA: acetylornithine/succinylornithine family transaminase [Polyangiaceae bacterium]
MSKSSELLETAKKHLYGNYRPSPFVVARGRGCELFDVDGKRCLDLSAGVAVSCVGHAHPALTAAIAEQAGKVIHASNYYWNEPNIRLAAELCARTGFERAFFCNSGAEANEALLKVARHHFYARGDQSRQRIVAFQNAFHGRTMGALSMTGTPKYREGFGEMGPVTHVPYGDLAAAKAAMGADVAAVIVEAVQGEGGVFVAPAGFIAGLRKICDEHGALLFVDEVQTGVGRLGRFLGHDGCGARADAIALAKGLAGGVPIGAMLTTEALAGALPPGTHGSTFGGNPLACTAALTVLKIIDDEKLIAGAKEKGEALQKMLDALVAEMPGVCESARGDGLLRGLVLRPGNVAREILPKILERGVMLTAAGERVLRFSPPLVVTVSELAEGVAVVRKVLGEIAAKSAGAVASV